MLLLIAELIRSYPQTAETVLSLKHSDHSFLQLLLESIILDSKQNSEMVVAANAVFVSTSLSAQNTTECNETLVQIIQSTLHNVVQSAASKDEMNKEEGKSFCQKLKTLTQFTNLLKDCNQPTNNHS